MKSLRPVYLRSGKEIPTPLQSYRVPAPRARIQLDLARLGASVQRDLADALLTGVAAPDYCIGVGDLPPSGEGFPRPWRLACERGEGGGTSGGTPASRTPRDLN